MNPSDHGKVAVLMGGLSSEREVSLKSGAAVLKALKSQGVDAHGVDVGHDVLQVLHDGGFDRAFNILHGTGGEDGAMQGALETMDLPYTGSGVMASALSMDKMRSRYVLDGAGLPVPRFEVLEQDAALKGLDERLGLPLVIKPNAEGSSVGVSKVSEVGQLQAAYDEAAKYGDTVLAEAWLGGKELHAAILGNEALPLVWVEAAGEFYDYEAKYLSDTTKYHCPCGLPGDEEQAIRELALNAFTALGCRGWGRVDFLLDESGKPYVLEMNTLPGMTDHSLVPMAARQAGIGFEQLVLRILEASYG